MTDQCSGCRFGRTLKAGSKALACLRYPPRPVIVPVEGEDDEVQILSVSPEVDADWWCGEFRMAREPEPVTI
jgi:hypothetical protein